MQSWVINSEKKITLISEESADFNQKTHAKVKIARASLCQSDIAAFNARYDNLPIIPSRSALGMISESKNQAFSKGQRVYISPYVKREKKIYINGKDFNGYLSDFVVVSNDNIYSIPEMIPDEDFTFIEDIAMALKTCKLLEIKETQYIVLHGVSTLNIILGQFALYYQAIPIIVDTDDEVLRKAEEKGIYYTINSKKEKVFDRILEITAGNMADHLIIDSDALPQIAPDILKLCAQNAKVAIMGYNTAVADTKIDVSYIVGKRLSMLGINDGIGEIESAINMLATGVIRVNGLVEKLYDFSEVPDVFNALSTVRPRFKYLIKC